MEPLTTAAAFATVVSLLADFRSQRVGEARAEYDDFVSWLAEHRHDEILLLLRQNANTTTSIKALLREDREGLRERLDSLDRTLAVLAGSIEGFAGLAAALRPESRISTAALHFLRQFDASGASKVLQVEYDQTTEFLLLDANGGPLRFDDRRFMNDDLLKMVEIGLLRLEYNSKGENIFVYTRYAAEFVRAATDV